MYADLRSEKFLKKLVGRKDIEDALKRLDRLTQEVALMASAQILILTHSVNNKVTDVEKKGMDVRNNVAGVGHTLNDEDGKIDVVVKGVPRVEHLINPVFIAPMLDR